MPQIKQLREKRGLSQSQLAREMEMTETTIRNWEHGRTGLDWFERVARLCDVLQCTPNELFGYEGGES
jgi:transcriptional regulator with XRE-family HTH domain